MYRKTMYETHNKTMSNFVEKFNNSPVCKNIKMIPHPEETFDNDGIFIDTDTKRSIGYDWEYRDKHFANCELDFNTLGQFERKLKKQSIKIALQCDSTETGIAVGWHEDWLKEKKERRNLITDMPEKENGELRYTKHFEIYSFEKIDLFKNMISYAITQKLYSSKIFELFANKTQNNNIDIKKSAQVDNSINSPVSTMVEFFTSKGLKVVDKRHDGRCLLVLGNESEIGSIVREACRIFKVGGKFVSKGWITRARQ